MNARIAWLALGTLVTSGFAIGVGCAGDEEATQLGASACGNGIVDPGEECDDGNLVNEDSCSNNCMEASCGDGVVQDGEECDAGPTGDDTCTAECLAVGDPSTCGNGVVDPGEECDDGNSVNDDATCTNQCTTPICGDSIVQVDLGEDCDDGNSNEVEDNCPDDCMDGTPDPCDQQLILAGMVTNSESPLSPGAGITSVWAYGPDTGIAAGQEMCAAIGADHVCTYAEVVAAEANGEFESKNIPVGQEFWLHRVATPVPSISDPNTMTAPGPGGRCNDWEYGTNHVSDGEFGIYDPTGDYSPNGRKQGGVTYFFDDDTTYDQDPTDNACPGGMVSATNTNGAALGCPSQCGNAAPRAILCCYAECEQ